MFGDRCLCFNWFRGGGASIDPNQMVYPAGQGVNVTRVIRLVKSNKGQREGNRIIIYRSNPDDCRYSIDGTIRKGIKDNGVTFERKPRRWSRR